MEWLDGYSEYLSEKDITKFITKIGNLKKYKGYYSDDLDQLSDFYLANAGIIYLFVNYPFYGSFIPKAFEKLSYRQKLNFYAYYSDNDIRKNAMNFGFLSKYDQIEKELLSKLPTLSFYKIITWFINILSLGLYILLFLLIEEKLNSVLLSLMLIFIVDFSINKNNLPHVDQFKQQNDIIIQKLHNKLIEENKKWAKEKLIEAKWINSDGKFL